jgi:hypothetical protein
MKRKILSLLLGVFVVVFVLTFCAQIFITPQSQEAMADDRDCYWFCVEWCPPLECGAENICLRWELVCAGDPPPAVK